MQEVEIRFNAEISDNDGVMELFAADMKPYSNDESTLYAWQDLLENHD